MEAPYQFWVSNSNLCQKKRTVDCRTWKVKRNRFGFSEGWRVLMNEYWDWDLHWKESCQKKVETYSVILCQRTWLTAAWSKHQDGTGAGPAAIPEVRDWEWGQRQRNAVLPSQHPTERCWSSTMKQLSQMKGMRCDKKIIYIYANEKDRKVYGLKIWSNTQCFELV